MYLDQSGSSGGDELGVGSDRDIERESASGLTSLTSE